MRRAPAVTTGEAVPHELNVDAKTAKVTVDRSDDGHDRDDDDHGDDRHGDDD
ncbi:MULTISPECIES: hypothetical protein [unclassified Streptomyces]|uniref:hypothetical protein n=1 Tax=unclassified Streptomyces TaxID=2593676 RepID=UPI00224D48A6|nr:MULTISPECIES: hypothetical protein [unclassified Streptomyces]WSP60382.1 hypothetical protein OG306_26705 [Streptomyces sp. NBC_01241]WSU26751.1 hypothetical protein OG508_12430 [Streptomyces sp. NBC_01108]MCX4789433.1 hypothetical protein [Streptomyces sp. NBC_01221]MCX4794846.1 hypothetical protein [Streptomyces sp. NBC_01242]WSJ41341.1 hypothetical protein OG772_08980 [Streptomyces sp. NBC_01321]